MVERSVETEVSSVDSGAGKLQWKVVERSGENGEWSVQCGE